MAKMISDKRPLVGIAGPLGLTLAVAIGCSNGSGESTPAANPPTPTADAPAPSAAPAASPAAATTPAASPSTSTVLATVNALANAFPGTLALTVFPTGSGASLHLADAAAKDFDPNAKPLGEKLQEQNKIVDGTASSCLPDALGKSFTKQTDENCYEFDQDMIYGTNNAAEATPRFLGTKNGKSSTGEACLVAYTRNQVSQVIAMVDQTLGFGMAAICQHKKINTDAALPTVGGSVDLKPALEALFGDKAAVTSATLSRLDDQSGKAVYKILIKAKMAGDNISRTVGIIHSPKDENNKEYSGTLYTIMEGVPVFDGKAMSGTPTKYQHLNIVYQRSVGTDGKATLNAELRSAQIAKEIAAKAIDTDGRLDLNVGTNVATGTLGGSGYGDYTGYAQANQAVDGITFVAFNMNVDTNAGSLAYWKNPGGNYYENARGFNISISENSATGALEGCATSGSASTNMGQGISIRRYLNAKESANSLTLDPKGFWHPFMNSSSGSGTDADGNYLTRTQQGTNQQVKWYKPTVTDANLATTFTSQQNGSLITRQCFKQDKTSGRYEIDTAKITESAGFEILDTGNAVNAAKFITLPPPPEAISPAG